jgi:hypothetical protein
VADLASLATEYEKPKKKSGGSDLAALASAHKEPAEEPRGLKGSIFEKAPPPPETKARATRRVLEAQGEERQRKVAERVAAKEPKPAPKKAGYGLVGQIGASAPPKGVKPGLDISGAERREQERKAEKPGTIEVAGSRVRPGDPQYKALAQGQERTRKGAEAIITNVSAPLYPLRNVINSLSNENSKVKARHPNARSYTGAQLAAYNKERRESVLRGLEKSEPWKAFVQGLPGWMGGQTKETPFRPFEIAAKNDPKFRKQIEAAGGPGVWDFLASIPADAVPGLGQAKVVGGLQKAVTGKQVTLVPGKLGFKGADVQAAGRCRGGGPTGARRSGSTCGRHSRSRCCGRWRRQQTSCSRRAGNTGRRSVLRTR